ncbi:hypothetical protein JXM67_13190, partial [candidate division WOR-3 bacterium]|nr:hypothetical protein [candidate division WOR-3 bacterium]
MVHVFLILRLVLITIGPQISWVKFIDKGEDEKLYGMDISKSNLYLAGGDLSEDSSFIFLKLDNSGSEKLSRLYWESGSGYEIGNDLAVFPSGNIVITGWYEVGHLPAWYTLWIDSLGERLYDDSMPIDYNGYTYNSNCVEPFSNGQCYVGGWFGNQTNQGIRVAKYDSQGKLIWKHFLYESNLDRPVKIAIDSEESVYALSEYHCTWIGWSKEGNQLGSVKDYIFSAAEGAAIRVNPTNHVFISGDLTESDRDFMLLKYDTDGNLLWPSHKAYDLGGEEECRDMALDAVSDCYLTGYQIRGEEEDAAIVKTDSAGNLLWAWVDTVPGKQEIEAIEVDEEGYV